jgi:hypothetical protein
MDVANAATIGGSILKVICDIARAFDIPAETSDSSQANLSRQSHRGCKTELSRSSFPASRPRPFQWKYGSVPAFPQARRMPERPRQGEQWSARRSSGTLINFRQFDKTDQVAFSSC